jgi:hypothetical protein
VGGPWVNVAFFLLAVISSGIGIMMWHLYDLVVVAAKLSRDVEPLIGIAAPLMGDVSSNELNRQHHV